MARRLTASASSDPARLGQDEGALGEDLGVPAAVLVAEHRLGPVAERAARSGRCSSRARPPPRPRRRPGAPASRPSPPRSRPVPRRTAPRRTPPRPGPRSSSARRSGVAVQQVQGLPVPVGRRPGRGRGRPPRRPPRRPRRRPGARPGRRPRVPGGWRPRPGRAAPPASSASAIRRCQPIRSARASSAYVARRTRSCEKRRVAGVSGSSTRTPAATASASSASASSARVRASDASISSPATAQAPTRSRQAGLSWLIRCTTSRRSSTGRSSSVGRLREPAVAAEQPGELADEERVAAAEPVHVAGPGAVRPGRRETRRRRPGASGATGTVRTAGCAASSPSASGGRPAPVGVTDRAEHEQPRAGELGRRGGASSRSDACRPTGGLRARPAARPARRRPAARRPSPRWRGTGRGRVAPARRRSSRPGSRAGSSPLAALLERPQPGPEGRGALVDDRAPGEHRHAVGGRAGRGRLGDGALADAGLAGDERDGAVAGERARARSSSSAASDASRPTRRVPTASFCAWRPVAVRRDSVGPTPSG